MHLPQSSVRLFVLLQIGLRISVSHIAKSVPHYAHHNFGHRVSAQWKSVIDCNRGIPSQNGHTVPCERQHCTEKNTRTSHQSMEQYVPSTGSRTTIQRGRNAPSLALHNCRRTLHPIDGHESLYRIVSYTTESFSTASKAVHVSLVSFYILPAAERARCNE